MKLWIWPYLYVQGTQGTGNMFLIHFCPYMDCILLQSIERNSFYRRPFRKLEELHLNRNEITNIQPGTFDFLTALVKLDLSENRLTHISLYYFRNLTSLDELHLEFNKIREIDEGSMSNLRNLRVVNFTHNYLNDLTNLSFSGCRYALSLCFSFNNLTEVKGEFFSQLPSGVGGHKINFQGNAINKLRLFSKSLDPVSLNMLDVSHNKLETIENTIWRSAAHIDRLDLAHNQIKKIQSMDFVGFVTKELILHHNLLQDVVFLLKMETKPQFVDLCYNKLIIITGQEMRFLTSITLATIPGYAYMQLPQISC